MQLDYGLIFTLDNQKKFYQGPDDIITSKKTIAKKYVDAILSIENGKRFDGYIKVTINTGPNNYEPYPKNFKLVIDVLNHLKCTTVLQDSEPKKKTKGKYIIVKLNEEQETDLNNLKALCSK